MCPYVSTNKQHGSCLHWFIEFVPPKNMVDFSHYLNQRMMAPNIYYNDLVNSGVIDALKIYSVKSGGFSEYMKSIGKFGGQNKCPHHQISEMLAFFTKKLMFENKKKYCYSWFNRDQLVCRP